jgi:hypothetical protein
MNQKAEHDLSWLLIGYARDGYCWIIDAAEGFYETDVLIEGVCGEDEGLIVPNDLDKGCLYLVREVKISEKGSNDDLYCTISGNWKKVFPYDTNPRMHLASGQGYEEVDK